MPTRYCHEAGCSRATAGHLYDPETCPTACDSTTDADDVPRPLPCHLEAGHDGRHEDDDGGMW